jgi:hypothetical protein
VKRKEGNRDSASYDLGLFKNRRNCNSDYFPIDNTE